MRGYSCLSVWLAHGVVLVQQVVCDVLVVTQHASSMIHMPGGVGEHGALLLSCVAPRCQQVAPRPEVVLCPTCPP